MSKRAYVVEKREVMLSGRLSAWKVDGATYLNRTRREANDECRMLNRSAEDCEYRVAIYTRTEAE